MHSPIWNSLLFSIFLATLVASPIEPSAEPGVSSRGSKKRTRKAAKQKRSKRPKRTKAQKRKVADAKACGAACKKLKKGSKASKACFRKCLGTSLKAARKRKGGATSDGPGSNRETALISGCRRQCKKQGKSSEKDGRCVKSCLTAIRSGKHAKPSLSACRRALARHCPSARSTDAKLSCLSKLPKARKKFSKACQRALASLGKSKQSQSNAPTLAKAPTGTVEIYLPGDLKKSSVTYTVSGHDAIDGCINLGPVEGLEKRYGKPRLPKAISRLFKKRPGARGGAAVSRTDYLWPRGEIPYLVRAVRKPGSSRTDVYTADIPTRNGKEHYLCKGSKKGQFGLRRDNGVTYCGTPTKAEIDKAVATIRDAATELTRKTALTFIEISAHEVNDYPYFVEFGWEPNGECWSKVGREIKGGQPLRCDYTHPDYDKGAIMHEMLHAAGFYHTMARPDAHKHIKLSRTNTCRDQFQQRKNHYVDYCMKKGVQQIGAYDLESIMHYDSGRCSDGWSPSFTLVKPATVFGKKLKKGSGLRLPKPRSLSRGDIQMIKTVYTDIGETDRSKIEWFCWWHAMPYSGNTGSRGARTRKITACQKKCGIGTARTKAGRKILKCREKCVK